MSAIVRSKVFQTGNSVAVRLPKGFGFTVDTEVELERRGREVIVREAFNPVAEKRKLLAWLDALEALPKPPSVQTREPIEFPEREGS